MKLCIVSKWIRIKQIWNRINIFSSPHSIFSWKIIEYHLHALMYNENKKPKNTYSINKNMHHSVFFKWNEMTMTNGDSIFFVICCIFHSGNSFCIQLDLLNIVESIHKNNKLKMLGQNSGIFQKCRKIG